MKMRIALASVIVAFCLFLLCDFFGGGNIPTDAFDYQPPPDDEAIGFAAFSEYIENEAGRVAKDIFGNTQESSQFQKELVSFYEAVRSYDIVLVFNSGGWGNTPLEDLEDEWDTVVKGVMSWFDRSDLTYTVIEHKRCQNTVRDILDEVKGFFTARYAGAKELAALLHFITSVDPDTRVVLLGASTGAMYARDAMKFLEGNPHVFSIQAGIPFWDKDPPVQRTLILDSDGATTDTLRTGDLWTMFKHNCLRLLVRFRPGNFVVLDDSITAPGHVYSWESPAIRNQVNDFLERYLGR